MGQETKELRQDIEQARENLGQDIDALNERGNPSRVLERKVGRTRSRVQRMQDRLMGIPSQARRAAESTKQGTREAAESARQGTQSAEEAVREAPQMAMERTQGTPLLAGLVAFGFGWLTAGLLPLSSAEERMGSRVGEKAKQQAGPVKEELRDVAQEARKDLQGPAMEAAKSVGKEATHAASNVGQESKAAASNVAEETKASAQEVSQQARQQTKGGSSS